MWIVFYASIGAGMMVGVVLYLAAVFGVHELFHNPLLGISSAAVAGLLIGFSYYLSFKFLLRRFTWPFLRRAQALTTRPIDELPPVWESSEIDKLDEILTEALATLERLDLFSSIAQDIVSTLDPERTLGHIIGTAVASLPADSGLVFLLDGESQRYTMQASFMLALPQDQMDRISFPAGEGVPGWVVTQGQPLIIPQAENDERVHPIIRQWGVKSLVSGPLVVGGRPLGALVLFNGDENDAFDENDARLLGIYADLAAVAIDNAQLYQRAEEDRNKLSAVLSDTTDAVVVLDQANRVLLLNPAAARYLDVQAEQVVNQPVEALGVENLVRALAKAQQTQAPVVQEINGPAERSLYVSVSPVREVGWVMVMQDVSSLKELDRLRTEWVTAVSHDLKNPINAITLAVEMLEEMGPLNEEQKEMLQATQRGIDQLTTLVTDVLDLARLEAGPALKLSQVDPKQVIDDALAQVRTLAAEKSLALYTDLPPDLPSVRGDAPLLTRALVNLLSNAVKYTSAGGQVTVSAQSQNGALQFEVHDTGRGIPEEALPHIFERFYRVPGSEDKEGSGLGLNTVKSIVEKHGGRVSVQSELGLGSSFSFSIPK